MPYRESSVGVDAILPFRDPNDPHAGGQIVLRDDGLLQLVPSPTLRRELERAVDRIDQGALKWGTSLVVGLAVVGTGLFWRRQRNSAYTLFTLSGLTGVGAFTARRVVRDLETWLLSPLPSSEVQISRHPASGGLRVVLNGGGARKLSAVIGANEFNPADADAFIRRLAELG